MSPKDADGMANTVDHVQTAPVCPGLSVRKLRIITEYGYRLFSRFIATLHLFNHGNLILMVTAIVSPFEEMIKISFQILILSKIVEVWELVPVLKVVIH